MSQTSTSIRTLIKNISLAARGSGKLFICRKWRSCCGCACLIVNALLGEISRRTMDAASSARHWIGRDCGTIPDGRQCGNPGGRSVILPMVNLHISGSCGILVNDKEDSPLSLPQVAVLSSCTEPHQDFSAHVLRQGLCLFRKQHRTTEIRRGILWRRHIAE
jgi:hypothetical protein